MTLFNNSTLVPHTGIVIDTVKSAYRRMLLDIPNIPRVKREPNFCLILLVFPAYPKASSHQNDVISTDSD